MERLTLAIPAVTPAITLSGWEIDELALRWRQAVIAIQLVGTNGEQKEERIEGETARTLMKALNTANLSIKSLHRRLMEWLIANRGYIGTIDGTPDA